MNQKMKQSKTVPQTPDRLDRGAKVEKKKATSENKQTTQVSTKSPSKYPLKAYAVSANWQKLQTELKSKQNNSKNKKLRKENRQNITNNNNNKANGKKTTAVPDASNNQQLITTTTQSIENKIWFDDVDPCLIKSSLISSSTSVTEKNLCKETSFSGLTRFVAMDCEMVGTGYNATDSMLARVSLVNLYGHCVYDKFVKPTEEVTDYRTEVSGIRPENLIHAEEFKIVQQEVYEIIRNRVLVGHAVHHDLKVLFLSQPKHMIRDTSHYFKKFFNNRPPALKKLTEVFLGVKIQHGEHDSITDAQATMRLYTLFKKKWESSLNKKPNRSQTTTTVQQTAMLNNVITE